ncbi:hypothetical protein [Amycolatopsis methanolica]|nr:hypothetical protein [Amycolatopsis methanolica]
MRNVAESARYPAAMRLRLPSPVAGYGGVPTVDNFRGRTPVSLNDLVYGLINLISAIVNSM